MSPPPEQLEFFRTLELAEALVPPAGAPVTNVAPAAPPSTAGAEPAGQIDLVQPRLRAEVQAVEAKPGEGWLAELPEDEEKIECELCSDQDNQAVEQLELDGELYWACARCLAAAGRQRELEACAVPGCTQQAWTQGGMFLCKAHHAEVLGEELRCRAEWGLVTRTPERCCLVAGHPGRLHTALAGEQDGGVHWADDSSGALKDGSGQRMCRKLGGSLGGEKCTYRERHEGPHSFEPIPPPEEMSGTELLQRAGTCAHRENLGFEKTGRCILPAGHPEDHSDGRVSWARASCKKRHPEKGFRCDRGSGHPGDHASGGCRWARAPEAPAVAKRNRGEPIICKVYGCGCTADKKSGLCASHRHEAEESVAAVAKDLGDAAEDLSDGRPR